jgi:hypothetical protein
MITWKQLSQNVLSGSASQQYIAPGSTYATIHAVSLWNPGASPVVVKFYIVPTGGSETDGTTLELITVPSGQSVSVPNMVNHKLIPGMSIWAFGNGVTCTISGAENVPS